VLAKCGPRYTWHWAHVTKAGCDPWWEGETDWHRGWKKYFPTKCQEVIRFESMTNEKHVADVITPNGTVIEFQNSSLTLAELKSRETFYGKMFWIVNGAKFKDNFRIGGKMPSREVEEVMDLRIAVRSRRRKDSSGQMFWYPNGMAIDDLPPQNTVEKDDGHRLFQWQHARTIWYCAAKPVIFDFGETGLFRMLKQGTHSFFVVKKIAKEELILKNGGNPRAETD